MTSRNRHNPGLSVSHLRRAPDGWLVQQVRYRPKGWSFTTNPSRVEWTGPSGIAWTVDVAVREKSLIPGACRIVSEVPATSSIDSLGAFALRDAVERAAVAFSSLMTFDGDTSPRWSDSMNSAEQCNERGRDWRYYVRRVMDGGLDTQVVERQNRPDYRQVALVYLDAIASELNPRRAIVNKLGCATTQLAGKWIERAAAHGWLTAPAGGSTRGVRSAGHRLAGGSG